MSDMLLLNNQNLLFIKIYITIYNIILSVSINISYSNKFNVESNSFKICVICTYIHLQTLPHKPYATYNVWRPYSGQLRDGRTGLRPGKAKVFSVHRNGLHQFCFTSNLLLNGCRRTSLEVKPSGRKVEHAHPCIAAVQLYF